MSGLLFWLLLILVFWLAWGLGLRSGMARAIPLPKPEPVVPMDTLTDWESRLAPMIAITGRNAIGKVAQFEGRLRGASGEMFRRIRQAFSGEAVTPMLLEGEGSRVRVLVLPEAPQNPASERPKWGLHWLLFAATLATTTWAGALHAGVNLLHEPGRFVVGLPYSLALLLILGAHELGHYFTARAHGIRVTPPFFIPVPFALGTFGAFIKIKSLPPNRRALFDVAVAGPLAGLVFAIPALFIGLHYSAVLSSGAPAALKHAGVGLDSSVLLAFLARLSLGAPLLEGQRLLLHPLAFAGWLGLIVTALNLLPIGQLDGGHMSHALFGSRRAHGISVAALALLFLLALFVWPGLMFWAFIVFLIAGTRDAPAANDVTPAGPLRQALGLLTFLLLALIIVPVPHSLFQMLTLHCPYL